MEKNLVRKDLGSMKTKLSHLPHTLVIASALLASSAFASAAQAQEQAESETRGTQTDEEAGSTVIVVTGSNIRRDGYAERAPVQVFGENSSELTAATSIIDFVGNLPANTGSMLSNVGTKNPNLIGASNFNLRNLGAGSTLVLINGRRAGKSPLADPLGNQFFDLNTLPTSIISRIDIQTDGASAIYGSEAVAGVVNVVTKLGFEGVELNARRDFGVSDSYGIDLAIGAKNDRGAFAIYGNYFDSQKTYNTDFDFLVNRLIDRDGDGRVDTTANGDPANSRFLSTSGAPDEYRNFSTGAVTGGSVIDPDCVGAGGYIVGANCLYDFSEQSGPIAGERRYSGFAEFRYELGEDLLGSDGVSIFGELGMSQNKANRAAGPLTAPAGPFGGKYLIPANHPFNYFVANGTGIRWAPGCFDSIAGNEGGTCVPVNVSTRDNLRPIGQTFSGRLAPEDSTFTNDSQRYLVGLNADYGDWNVSLWAQRHNHESVRSVPGNWIASRVQAALNDGTLNPFGSAEVTPDLVSLKNPAVTAGNDYGELQAYGALTTEVTRRKATQKTYDILISNGNLFELPGGDAGIALGFQRREETFRFDPTPNTNGGAPEPTIIGSTKVNSVFAETILPVIDNLEVQAAVRFEDHGTIVGKTVDPKIALRFDATPWLSFRGSYGTSFQAPSSNQQGGISNSGFVNYRTTGGVATCGGAEESSFIVAQVGRPVGSLKPQSAENINLGLVLQTSKFDASIDYWRYNYSDLIVNTQNAQAVIDNACSGVANGLPPTPSELIARTPNGQPTEITLALQNADRAITDGVDIAMSYQTETGIGDIGARLALTYVNRFAFTAGAVTTDLAGNRNFASGSFGSLPRWRGNLTGTFGNGNHNGFVVVRYVSSYTNDDVVGSTTVPEIKKYITADAQYSYSMEDLIGQDATLTLGIKDIFDTDPPNVGNNRPGFDEQVHSPRGRVVYVGIGLQF